MNRTASRGLWFFLAATGAGIFFLVTACKKDETKAPPPAKTPAPAVAVAKADGQKADGEEKEEVSVYAYNPVGKRDPFEPFVAQGPEKDSGVPLTPLQEFSIDQLRLVGIVWGMSVPRAMVEDPRGKGHVLKKGTLIGRNWGKVTRIKPDEVVISEEYRDIDGKLVVNEISLKLPLPKELEE